MCLLCKLLWTGRQRITHFHQGSANKSLPTYKLPGNAKYMQNKTLSLNTVSYIMGRVLTNERENGMD
jgi:hypothetical protein